MKPAAKAYIIYHHKVLLILRDEESSNPDTWGLPGGGIEMGETDTEAMQRELREEISLVPTDVHFVKKVQITPDFYVSVFAATLTEDEAKAIKLGSEGKKMEFFTYGELESINLSPKLKKFLPKDEGLLKELLAKTP